MAGHSKWANIKHRKARVDAKRGKAWSKCAKAIMAAAKQGGGNPEANLTLRYAIDEAKAVNMPKDTIENAIKKGSGELGGANFESAIYEGYGSGGVAIMLDILTDNRNRTAAEVRKLFEKYGGNLGGSGCVAYLFESKGQIFIAKQRAGSSSSPVEVDEEAVMTAALEAGAQDVSDEDEMWLITCEPGDFMTVREALKQAGFTLESAAITMIPTTTVEVSARDAEKVLHLVDALEDHDDVQQVYANFDIPDEQLAAIEN